MNINNQFQNNYCGINIVCGGPISWLSWITFTYEFTSQWTYTQSFFKNLFKLSRLHYQRIKVPRNRKRLATHEHWPQRIQMIPQYVISIIKLYNKEIYWGIKITSPVYHLKGWHQHWRQFFLDPPQLHPNLHYHLRVSINNL